MYSVLRSPGDAEHPAEVKPRDPTVAPPPPPWDLRTRPHPSHPDVSDTAAADPLNLYMKTSFREECQHYPI